LYNVQCSEGENVRLTEKISFTHRPGLSVVISMKFTVEICVAV